MQFPTFALEDFGHVPSVFSLASLLSSVASAELHLRHVKRQMDGAFSCWCYLGEKKPEQIGRIGGASAPLLSCFAWQISTTARSLLAEPAQTWVKELHDVALVT